MYRLLKLFLKPDTLSLK